MDAEADKYIKFGIMTTIKSIGKSAVERNRVRTRFKAGVRMVLTRGDEEEPKSSSRSMGKPAAESSVTDQGEKQEGVMVTKKSVMPTDLISDRKCG